jgi:hypothetical protein
MGYSLKLKIDTYDKRQDGTCAIYFQVIINRKKKRLGLPISWPLDKFNEVKGCIARMKDDPDVDAFNIVIENARTKANDIRKKYLIEDRHLTIDAFMREYNSNLSKNDFIKYFEKKAFQRWNTREISDETYEKEKVVLRKLIKFRPIIPFSDFDSKWAKEFDKQLKKLKNDHNTRWGNHKIVNTYLNLARKEDKISFDNPYENFKLSMVESSWGPLDLEQMKKLLEFYLEWRNKPVKILHKNGVNQVDKRKALTYPEVVILRKFLFSCNSALRISDMMELDVSKFSNGEMNITPHKTERYGTNIKSVPLNDVARLLLDDEIADVAIMKETKPFLRIFERYVDQACNRVLKRIADKVGLNVNLHMHVGRYTFGSIMDQAGANHTGLMKYMGIKKRETLEKYVKTNIKVITSDIEKANNMINLEEQLNPISL